MRSFGTPVDFGHGDGIGEKVFDELVQVGTVLTRSFVVCVIHKIYLESMVKYV